MSDLMERVSWPVLVAGAMLTLVLSLSVHAVMLQGLHVPYPSQFPHTGWARLPDSALSVFGAMYLSALLPERIQQLSLARRSVLMFLFLSTIHEVLFRAPFMEFINLSNFTLYPFLDNLPKLIPLAAVSVGVEAWTPVKRSFAANIIAAVLLAAMANLVIAPVATHAFTGVLTFTEAREGNERYGLPYDWHILLPAYATYIEPVIAALVIGWAIRHQVSPEPFRRFATTAVLILALKGPVLSPVVNIHYANTSAITAVRSYAQFTFETVTLGILTALTLQLAARPPRTVLTRA